MATLRLECLSREAPHTGAQSCEGTSHIVRYHKSCIPRSGVFCCIHQNSTNVSGSDQDRVYNGTLFAIDADGDRSAVEFTVSVLQDKSEKNDFPIAQQE